MQKRYRFIIVGAGPIGLSFARQLENKRVDYLVLEATDQAGGQLVRLYPEKEIVDVNEFETIKAKELIEHLLTKVDLKKIVFNQKVIDIQDGDSVKVKTNDNEYECDYLVVATGLGTSVPRPLGVEHEKEVSNILYSLEDFSFLKDKKVAIFGGGDSALDWAKQLSKLSDNVHLIHRRLEFRGNADTIKDCHNLAIHLPYVPDHIEIENNKAKSITIKEVVEEGKEANFLAISVDFILVNYGNIAEANTFNFEKDGAFLKTDSNYKISEHIFAIGDVASYENKKRRIQPGINEADAVLKSID